MKENAVSAVDLNRRDFLKNAALLVAAGSAQPHLFGLYFKAG